jgi:hypothetical protein
MSPNILELIDYDFKNILHCEIKYSIEKLVLKQISPLIFETKKELLEFHRNLISFTKQFNYLREIEIVNYIYLTDNNVNDLGAEFLSNIQTFCLDGCESLTAETFKLVNKYCSSLLSFTFICPNNAKIFYLIDTYDLISFMQSHEMLEVLSLMLLNLDITGFAAICSSKHITCLIINVYNCDEFTNSSSFFQTIMRLLATPSYKEVCFYQNFEHLGCYDMDSCRLTVCVATCDQPYNLNQLIIDVLYQRRGTIMAVTLADIVGLKNIVLSELANTNGDSLRDLMIYSCGNIITFDTVNNFANQCLGLLFVFIVNGSKTLGSSGTCSQLGSTVLALLNDGYLFSLSYLEEIGDMLHIQDKLYLLTEFTQKN